MTRTVEDYKRVLSNPEALDLINHRLLKYGLLRETYSTLIRESFDAFKTGDENFYNNLKMFKALFPNVDDFSWPDSKLFQKRFKSLSEGEMESLLQEAISHFVNKPSYPVFFVFSLYKLGITAHKN